MVEILSLFVAFVKEISEDENSLNDDVRIIEAGVLDVFKCHKAKYFTSTDRCESCINDYLLTRKSVTFLAKLTRSIFLMMYEG